MKGINFVKLLKGYKKGWVAISEDFRRVVSWGRTLRSVSKKVKGKGKVYFHPSGEKNYENFIGV